jgi:hypothetical protein
MALAFLQAMIAGCAKQPVVSSDPLNGAWRLAEMRLVLADGRNIPVPAQESLVLFADGYYSICYAFGDSSVPYKKRWRPSGEEKRARFSSMIVNSGSYLLDGDRIDAKPLFALAPEFVNGKGEFSFAFKADTLELTWDKSIAFDGLEYPSQGTVTRLKLVRAN